MAKRKGRRRRTAEGRDGDAGAVDVSKLDWRRATVSITLHGNVVAAFPDLAAFDAYVEGLKIAAALDEQRDVAVWN